eukprot:GHVQ01031204.1.p2 GENE.GHVQ01031204.1~~GHVQ01031204.1.p2  ORF type:complete len:128 (+),score=9.64 GHVQ01031204.1:431-814(+)
MIIAVPLMLPKSKKCSITTRLIHDVQVIIRIEAATTTTRWLGDSPNNRPRYNNGFDRSYDATVLAWWCKLCPASVDRCGPPCIRDARETLPKKLSERWGRDSAGSSWWPRREFSTGDETTHQSAEVE